ncbi:MAG: carboxypeptidase-like regulatory domain-containing protein, partial [Vicinamibacterales bacterium]
MSPFGWGKPTLCFAVGLYVAAPGYAQPQGRITGSVVDATNAPLVNVTIALRGPVERKAQSGDDGAFAFAGLPEGEYQVQAALPGFAPTVHTVRLAAGETASVVLRLSVLAFDKIVVTAGKSGELDAQAVPMAVSVLPGTE